MIWPFRPDATSMAAVSSPAIPCARLSCEVAMIPSVKITAADANFLAMDDLHTVTLKPLVPITNAPALLLLLQNSLEPRSAELDLVSRNPYLSAVRLGFAIIQAKLAIAGIPFAFGRLA